MATEEKAAEDKSATRAEYQVALESAKAALQAMEKKHVDPASSEAMRALYLAEITRLDAQIAAMENALEDYNSPEKFKERETARERWVGKHIMNTVRQGGRDAGPASSWFTGAKQLAGKEDWLLDPAELEADGYEKFTTPDGKTAWRLTNPES